MVFIDIYYSNVFSMVYVRFVYDGVNVGYDDDDDDDIVWEDDGNL